MVGLYGSETLSVDGGSRTRKAHMYSSQLCRAIAAELVYAKPVPKGPCFLLDIFGGTGGVARAALKQGVPAFVVDLTLGTSADACSD